MTQKERIKEMVLYLKLIRRTSHVLFRSLIKTEQFRQRVMQPLEEMCDWEEKDQKEAVRLAEEIVREARSVGSGLSQTETDEIKKIIAKHLR